MLIELIVRYSKTPNILFLIFFFSATQVLADEGLEIEIDNPKFSEKGLDNRLYEIKAERGIQRENDLELFGVEGKLRTDSGIWIYLNSDQGNFNQLNNLIELHGNIIFYTNENEKLQSDNAIFNMDKDLVNFSNNVKHTKGGNVITSDESKVQNNFNHIIYRGSVNAIFVVE